MNLLLIDDHPIILEALATMMIKRYPAAQISAAPTMERLHTALSSPKNWSGAFVDINFNGALKGLDIIQMLCHHGKEKPFPVIVISMHSESHIIRAALDKGACAYVVKMDPAEEIFRAFEEYAAGKVYLSVTAQQKMSSDTKPREPANS